MKVAVPELHRTRRPLKIAWIRELASPYLKGYAPVAAREDGLSGYWFIAESSIGSESTTRKRSTRSSARSRPQAGFFIGYLTQSEGRYSFLRPESPECLIFVCVSPAGGALHQRLVRQQGSLVRETFEYIRWLTHRPPRFVFHEAQDAAMTRHASMKDWGTAKREHLSKNFFIETLAWLVRSGLVRKLREGSSGRS